MSFSRYTIQKKQVSTDRGVTWVDVEPIETQKGGLVGVKRTLIECEDMSCELEEDRYTTVTGPLPNEICGSQIRVIPYGIAKNITFTAGAVCCSQWWDAGANVKDFLGRETPEVTGHRVCAGSTCPTWSYRSYPNNGSEMTLGILDGTAWGGCEWIDGISTCLTIDELMPWAEGKESWLFIQKQHYSREHCSDEWAADGEPQIIGIAERWVFVSDDFFTETWQHQIATAFNDDGTVKTWQDQGTPDITYYGSELPDGIEVISEIRADGSMYNVDEPNPMYMEARKTYEDEEPSGMICSSLRYYSGNETAYTFNASAYTLNDTLEYYPFVWNDSTAYYGGMLCKPWYSTDRHGFDYIRSISDVCNNVSIGRMRLYDTSSSTISIQSKACTKFPYRKPRNYGFVDNYYNTTEYGYIDRDNNITVIGYVSGKYIDINGGEKALTSPNHDDKLGIPHLNQAVSITFFNRNTEIPEGWSSGSTTLSSLTLSDSIEVIHNEAFKGCTALEHVDLGNSIEEIGSSAFSGCTALTGITLPGSIRTMRPDVFNECTSLENVILSEGLTTIGSGTFHNCTSLKEIEIPSSVPTIDSYAFTGCSSLSSVTLNEGLDTIEIEAFSNCNAIRDIDIPSTVTQIKNMAFHNCSVLSSATINSSCTINKLSFGGCNIKTLTVTVTTPPTLDKGNSTYEEIFTFDTDAMIYVPAEAVDTYKTATGWSTFASMIYQIPH